METSIIWGIAGVFATIVVGAVGVRLARKWKYPGQITFIREDSISLFHSIVKSLPDLDVQYKSKPVSEGLVLLKGFLLNTGHKDISESMVEEKIAIVIPDGYKWLIGKVTSSSPNVTASIRASDQKLIFAHGLFRHDEFIRFHALAETPVKRDEKAVKGASVSKPLPAVLSFTHRIADTQKIITRELVHSHKRSRFWLVWSSMVVIGLFYSIWIIKYAIIPPQERHISLMLASGQDTVATRIIPKSDDTIIINAFDGSYVDTVLLDHLVQRSEYIPCVAPRPSWHHPVFITCLFVVFVLYIVFPILKLMKIYTSQRETKRLMGLLSSAE